jgi:PPOX class probable F420-dependent enzyme
MQGEGDPLAGLDNYKFINLVTYRRSGVAVPTPVWFKVAGDHIYVQTSIVAGKIKRIAHTARVTLWPSDVRGNALAGSFEATARLIEDPAAQERAEQLLQQKYGDKRTIFLQQIGVKKAGRVYLEITPTTAVNE